MLVKLVELVDVDLAESVLGAELVDLVVDLVVDPRLIVVDRVVLDCGPGHVWLQSVDHLDFLEVDDDTALGAAGNAADSVSLNGDLDSVKIGDEGHFGVPAGLSGALKQGAAPEVHADVAFRDLVQATPANSANQ